MAATRRLSDKDIEKIVDKILKWPLWKPFSWEEIRSEIKIVLGLSEVSAVWSRQQLEKYDAIKSAYKTKKKQIRAEKAKSKGKTFDENLPPRERELMERITSLEAEVQHLRAENDRLHEKFERWLYNARVKNVSAEILNQPLPIPKKEKV